MNIIKAKITKDNTLVVVYKDEDGNNVTLEGKNIVHSDLTNAFKQFVPHFAFLCEQRESNLIDRMDELPDTIYDNLEVSGYSIGGSDSSEGVTLSGKRFLKSSKILNLNSPFTMFNDENEEYKYAFELHEVVQSCNYEVEQYLFEKKWSFIQQELPFNEDAEADGMPFADAVAETTVDELMQSLEGNGVTMSVNGKRVKPRKPRSKKETAA